MVFLRFYIVINKPNVHNYNQDKTSVNNVTDFKSLDFNYNGSEKIIPEQNTTLNVHKYKLGNSSVYNFSDFESMDSNYNEKEEQHTTSSKFNYLCNWLFI